MSGDADDDFYEADSNNLPEIDFGMVIEYFANKPEYAFLKAGSLSKTSKVFNNTMFVFIF